MRNSKIPKEKFQPQKKAEVQYEALSVTTLLGEKAKLMEALNATEHGYRSFAELNRAALNLLLKKLGSNFKLTVR